MAGGRLWVGVLGPLEVRVGDRPIAVRAGLPRALLVALALAQGRVVGIEALADLLWGVEPPRDPRSAVQNTVLRLRRLLGPGVIETAPGGYRLAVDSDQVDAIWFRDLVAEAGRHEQRTLLDQALGLWRGVPLTGVGAERLVEEYRPGLVETWLGAVERRVDLDPVDARWIPELEQLVAEYPLRESLWERLIRVLAGAGRRAEALAAYERLRAQLAEELGASPSAGLRQLHGELLVEEKPSGVVPRQLPAPARWFSGRDEELRRLGNAQTGRGRVLVLHGPGGVGKTTLALEWAHRQLAAFPDGQVYLDLRGFGADQPLDTAQLLGIVLRAFGERDTIMPRETPERSALLRTRLADRRALLFLDNARDAAQVRALLAGGNNTVLITSRNDLRSLAVREGAERIPIEHLAPQRATELLTTVIGPHSHPGQLTELADLCGGLPLALMIAAQRINHQVPRTSLATALAEVATDLRQTRLDTLADPQDPETDLRTVLLWSYQALEPTDAHLFRLLGTCPTPRFHEAHARAIIGRPEVNRSLERLESVHLIDRLDGGSWHRMHDLVWRLAAELCRDAPDRQAAADRLVDWYLQTTGRAGEAAFSVSSRDSTEPLAGVSPPEFAGPEDAMRWFRTEEEVLPAVVAMVVSQGRPLDALHLIAPITNFQLADGRFEDRLRLADLSARLADELDDDRERAAAAFRQLGSWHRLGEYENALRCATVGLAAAERAGDLRRLSSILSGRALVQAQLGLTDEAVSSSVRSVEVAEDIGAPLRIAHATGGLTEVYWKAGRLPEATAAARRTLELYRAHGSPYHQALALGNLSEIQLTLGEPAAALTAAEAALELLAGVDDHLSRPNALLAKGRALLALGDPAGARRAWTEALGRLKRVRGAIPEERLTELRNLLAQLPADS